MSVDIIDMQEGFNILFVKKLHPDAKLPTQAHSSDAGFDLYCCEDLSFKPNELKVVSIGIAFELKTFQSSNYYIEIKSKSGLASKGITTRAGIIDIDYRGGIKVVLKNELDTEFFIPKGSQIAQFIVLKHHNPIISPSNYLNETSRGITGFGENSK